MCVLQCGALELFQVILILGRCRGTLHVHYVILSLMYLCRNSCSTDVTMTLQLFQVSSRFLAT